MKKIYEDIIKAFESKTSFRILCGFGILIVALIIFAGGITIGLHKASYGEAWEKHYEENFGMGFRGGYGARFPIAHGAAGKIIKIELPSVIVQERDNTEKTISIGADTTIQKEGNNILPADLKVDDFVVAIGTPDDKGIVEAKFIRVMPLGMPITVPVTPAPAK